MKKLGPKARAHQIKRARQGSVTRARVRRIAAGIQAERLAALAQRQPHPLTNPLTSLFFR